MFGQDLAGPADEAGGRLVARRGEQTQVVQDLLAVELAHGTGLVLELGVEQVGHEIVRGVLGPPVDVVGEAAAVEGAPFESVFDMVAVLVETHAGVDAITDLGLVLLGNAQQHADGLHGHLGGEVSDEVEAARADQRVEAGGAEGSHLGLDVVHAPRGEHSAEQAAVRRVGRRVLEEDDARRHLHAELGDRLNDFEHRALARQVDGRSRARWPRRRRSG